jgi:hypothetical protein
MMVSKILPSNENIPITICVKNARGSNIASKLTGYFIVNNRQFRFTAVAFGRIGGHNIALTIGKKTLNEISKMGIEPDTLQLTIQRKLIEGDVIIPDTLKLHE